MTTPDPLPTRVRELLTDAVNRLGLADRAERISYAQATGNHGVTMHLDADDDLVEFKWGGKPLAMVPRDVLLDDQPLPEPTFIAQPPDTIPDERNE
jgi:hypothetical protein